VVFIALVSKIADILDRFPRPRRWSGVATISCSAQSKHIARKDNDSCPSNTVHEHVRCDMGLGAFGEMYGGLETKRM
jgi:hypothetical protein